MPPRILIVEDEALVAMEIAAVLHERGYQPVGVAADTRSARALASKGVDLALVDCQLRDGVTGPQIGRHLMDEHGAAVIFVTANPRLVEHVRDAHGVIAKPSDEDTLCAAIEAALQARDGPDGVKAPM
ncbi:MAG: response regulator [Alphaproteobacteria bacterium]|nr:response regulator [Alphaproteobacteria bacterium]